MISPFVSKYANCSTPKSVNHGFNLESMYFFLSDTLLLNVDTHPSYICAFLPCAPNGLKDVIGSGIYLSSYPGRFANLATYS